MRRFALLAFGLVLVLGIVTTLARFVGSKEKVSRSSALAQMDLDAELVRLAFFTDSVEPNSQKDLLRYFDHRNTRLDINSHRSNMFTLTRRLGDGGWITATYLCSGTNEVRLSLDEGK